MRARILVLALAAAALVSAPAFAADPANLQTFRHVQRQVLQYPHFTIFDSVNTQINTISANASACARPSVVSFTA